MTRGGSHFDRYPLDDSGMSLVSGADGWRAGQHANQFTGVETDAHVLLRLCLSASLDNAASWHVGSG